MLFGAFSCVVLVKTGRTQSTKIETAGQKFKNIKVLRDMPADQLGKVMNIMSASLNVNCDFCHVGYEFEKDDKEHKQIAREMIKMTFEINQKYFDRKTEVSCNTCHNGQPHPHLLPNLIPKVREPRIVQPKDKPSAEAVIARYERLIGSRSKNARFKAQRIEPDGNTLEPVEITITDGKVRLDTKYDGYLVSEIFDGSDAVKLGNGSPIELKPDEKEQIRREAQLLTSDLKRIYDTFDPVMLAKIDGREVYRIGATTSTGVTEQLFFDAKSGFLIRRTAASATVLGDHVFQADYSEYKKFSGIKVPATTAYAMPAVYWTLRIVSARNASIRSSR